MSFRSARDQIDSIKLKVITVKMDFGELNKVAEFFFLPRSKFLDLQEDTNYRVTKIRRVPTKFGVHAVVVELDDSFQTFFPNRVNFAVDKDEALLNKLCSRE